MVKQATGVGERDALWMAPEQLSAERGLERPDLLTEGGLLDAQLRRRAGHMSRLGDRDEVAKLANVHIQKYRELRPSIFDHGPRGAYRCALPPEEIPMKHLALLALAVLAAAAQAAPPAILFVGNSYTFGRIDPVLSYNNANVDDMTRPRPDLPDPTSPKRPARAPGSRIPGAASRVSSSSSPTRPASSSTFDVARNAATLRGHFLNTANADWDLRGNIAKRKWDIVVLQEQSDARCRPGRGANANYPSSAPTPTRSRSSSTSALRRATASARCTRRLRQRRRLRRGGGTHRRANNTLRTIPPTRMPVLSTEVYLTADLGAAGHGLPNLATVADANYPTVPDGRPIVDTTNPAFPNGYPDTLYYEAEGLAGLTADLRAAFARRHRNARLRRRDPGGRSVPARCRRSDREGRRFYGSNGVYAPYEPSDKINLWWDDYLHASKHGSYLSALVIFGTLTGISPASFGASEKAAADLGINPGDAVRLQRVAADQLRGVRPADGLDSLPARQPERPRPQRPGERPVVGATNASIVGSALAADENMKIRRSPRAGGVSRRACGRRLRDADPEPVRRAGNPERPAAVVALGRQQLLLLQQQHARPCRAARARRQVRSRTAARR